MLVSHTIWLELYGVVTLIQFRPSRNVRRFRNELKRNTGEITPDRLVN
jgi:hypothetical protein